MCAILLRTCFIMDVLLAISRIFLNTWKTLAHVRGMEPLGCVLSLRHSLGAFTFIVVEAQWVRSLEISPKINFFCQTWIWLEAYGLALLHLKT